LFQGFGVALCQVRSIYDALAQAITYALVFGLGYWAYRIRHIP
jgi:hypothetical protein